MLVEPVGQMAFWSIVRVSGPICAGITLVSVCALSPLARAVLLVRGRLAHAAITLRLTLIGSLLVLVLALLILVLSLLILELPPLNLLAASRPLLGISRPCRRRGFALTAGLKRGQTEEQNRSSDCRRTHSFRVSNPVHRSFSRQRATNSS